ncbi:major facilitator superfamily domain-containing protein [Cunninghamella echinulata]|nr:major facilitator superfamily domain-containing protein [Cunninghamella echinulata]
MKNTIIKEFGISNLQYGVIQSSVSIVNTILPVLGGIFIDCFGTIPGSIITTILITSGNVLVALSTHSANWHMMIFGRILYGIGSGTVVIVQETILSQWFKGRSLAAVIALMLTVSRLASFMAQATVIPIANWSGWYGYGFWFSAILCFCSLLVNLVYIVLLRKVSISDNDRCHRLQKIKQKKAFQWSKLLYLPHSYWLIVSMEFLLGGGWGCFLHINSELVKFKFGYDNANAAAIASVSQVLPIILMPLLGVFVDKYGRRTWLMIGSGITFTLALYLLEYTSLHPIIAMLSFSISLALGPVGLVSSVPVLLPLSLVGTGMGLIKSGTNVGASLFDITTGWLQDRDPNKGYSGVIIFFIIIGSLAILSGTVLWVIDRSTYQLLDQSAIDAQRRLKLDQEQQQSANHELKRVKSDAMEDQPLKMNYFYGFIFVCFLLLSWTLFFRFVIHL